ncbi:MAG: hypothetical protein RDU41_10005 [Clostridia bacterium]|nr:hypothetical protein [Clostridia bacterium]
MIASMLIGPLFLIGIVALIALIVAGIRAGDSSDGGHDMIKNVYIYLVLFATLMMTIGGSVAAFMAIADIIAPTPYYQQFEDYTYSQVPDREGVEKAKLSEEELKVRNEAMAIAHHKQQIEGAKNSLIKSFGWIIIPLPVFMYYQRRLVGKEA